MIEKLITSAPAELSAPQQARVNSITADLIAYQLRKRDGKPMSFSERAVYNGIHEIQIEDLLDIIASLTGQDR